MSEYQVRDYRSLIRHFILVFCAYTFILWHTLTGGLRRRWANKSLNTFVEALEQDLRRHARYSGIGAKAPHSLKKTSYAEFSNHLPTETPMAF